MSHSPDAAGHPRWRWLLAGAGLFAAGGVIGALLMLSLFLYRLPAVAPATPTASSSRAPASPRSPSSALPTPVPTPTALPVGPAVGQQAPSFALPALDGAVLTLEAFRGRTVLLHFWASWCRPCREEWPEWVAFGTTISDTVAILAVNVEETPEAVRAFLDEQPPPFPVLLDADGAVSDLYRVTALPTTFLIDPQGMVQEVVPGNLGRDRLEQLIAR